MTKQDPTIELDARVRLAHDVDRYPHFVAPAGAEGTVVRADHDLVAVRLDEHLAGAEDWQNEVQWQPCNGDDPARDLVLLERRCPECRAAGLEHADPEDLWLCHGCGNAWDVDELDVEPVTVNPEAEAMTDEWLDAERAKWDARAAEAGACQALVDRVDVTRRLASAFDTPLDVAGLELGSEKALLVVFSVVHGIVNEYLDGGDQMVEACTCGRHDGRPHGNGQAAS